MAYNYLGNELSISGPAHMLNEPSIPADEIPQAKKELNIAAETMRAQNPGLNGINLSGLLVGGTYSPDLSSRTNQQNVYHTPYENYQPVVSDSRQYDITYPNYTTIIGSPDAIVANKKETVQSNSPTQTPYYYQPETYTPSNSQDESSGIDPMILLGGAAVLVLLFAGGVFLVRK